MNAILCARKIRGALVLASLAITLALGAIAGAQDLRLVRGGEFGPDLKGLTGRGPLSSFGVWELPALPAYVSRGWMEPSVTNATRRIMYFWVDVVNLDSKPFILGNAFANPAAYDFHPTLLLPISSGLWGASISDTNGNVLRERVGASDLAWDAVCALPTIPRQFRGWNGGISGGCAAITVEPYFGSWVDITGLQGEFIFTLILDPLNLFGQFDPAKNLSVRISINGFDARLQP